MTATIHTDLLTPLGAYLRLRASGDASFLLESVDQGRLGRYSLVGCGSRLRRRPRGASCSDEPVVGHVGYDWIAELEPTVPLPEAGPGLPVSRFVVADDAPALRPRPRRLGGASRRSRRDRGAARRERPTCRDASSGQPLGTAASLPRPGDARGRGRAGARSTSGPATRSRSSSPQRAERPTSATALEIYRALRRINPSPYLFLLELGELRAGRLVARDAREARGDARAR